MMYSKQELLAMQAIASKLNWHKPAYETVETITKMVWNQQSLMSDCTGGYCSFEDTLEIMASWDEERLLSTIVVSDYQSLIEYNFNVFLGHMGITHEDYYAMVDYYESLPERIEQDKLDALHEQWEMEELAWYNHARQMGWE